MATKGDVIEFGIGYGSTGFLRNLLAGTGRRLVSIESNAEWLDIMRAEFPESKEHSYVHCEDWGNYINEFKYDREISIIFIDQNSWDARVSTCETLKGMTEYVIMHDADYFPGNGVLGRITDGSLPYSDELKYDFSSVFGGERGVAYRLYFPPAPWSERRHGPPTLVGSVRGRPIIPYEDIEFEY